MSRRLVKSANWSPVLFASFLLVAAINPVCLHAEDLFEEAGAGASPSVLQPGEDLFKEALGQVDENTAQNSPSTPFTEEPVQASDSTLSSKSKSIAKELDGSILSVPAGELFDLVADADTDLFLHVRSLGGTMLQFHALEQQEHGGSGKVKYVFQAPPTLGLFEIKTSKKRTIARLRTSPATAKILAPYEIDICAGSIPVRYKGPRGKFDRLELQPAGVSGTKNNGYVKPASITPIKADSPSSLGLQLPETPGEYLIGYYTQASMAVYVPVAQQKITVLESTDCSDETSRLDDLKNRSPADVLKKFGIGGQ